MEKRVVTVLSALVAGALFAGAAPARADEKEPLLPDWLAVHGQGTFTLQATPGFPSPYVGDHSLTPNQGKETLDATLYLGVRPWRGGEIWANPEVDQGFGLSNTLGVAGFPSGEAYKVGKASPYIRVQRLFLCQTVDLGGDREEVDGGENQFAGSHAANRLVFTLGRFSVGDVFDTNKYAHDPRGDFLNWTIIEAGGFDYAANAWGYSDGLAVEWYQGAWAVRAGLFNLSTVPNGDALEHGFQQYHMDGEIEHRHRIAGGDGAIRVTIFRNRGNFGRFDDALELAAATDALPDTALVRRRESRMGASLNIEQAVTGSIGLFGRASFVNGAVEPYEFTDVDRSASAGVSINGKGWGRSRDTVGVAAVVNGITAEHRRYLAAGGLGLLVGDGRLPDAGDEAIGEAYYDWSPIKPVNITLDYQLVEHPGYNRERGPANVFAMRLHGQF